MDSLVEGWYQPQGVEILHGFAEMAYSWENDFFGLENWLGLGG